MNRAHIRFPFLCPDRVGTEGAQDPGENLVWDLSVLVDETPETEHQFKHKNKKNRGAVYFSIFRGRRCYRYNRHIPQSIFVQRRCRHPKACGRATSHIQRQV